MSEMFPVTEADRALVVDYLLSSAKPKFRRLFEENMAGGECDMMPLVQLAAFIRIRVEAEAGEALAAHAEYENMKPTSLEVDFMQNLFAWNEDGSPVSLIDHWPGLIHYVRKHVEKSVIQRDNEIATWLMTDGPMLILGRTATDAIKRVVDALLKGEAA